MSNGPKRILIVDDESDFTMMTRLTLQETGKYRVREENGGSLAVSAAREFRPDLILLDVMMPDMDGGDVVSALKADAITCNIPIVFLTALAAGEEGAASGLARGGRRFLAKPVSLDELMKCIDQTLAEAAADAGGTHR